tara:strand:+ start:3755 stop:4438 length:684 start_codon:yes stop_codon:yes gene_type:complete
MNIYTVIPARGGSKGIKKKNIKLLNKCPLIQYSIEYSLESSIVNRTVVSTDCNEIAKISINCGAEVPFIRPKEYAEDLTPDFPVFNHALLELEKIYNEKIDFLILLRPTSPFRPKGLIEEGIKKMTHFQDADSLRSVTLVKEHAYRQWKMKDNFIVGYEKSIDEPYNLPRQLLPELFFQTGDIEIVRRSTLINGSISGKKVLPLVIDHDQMLDIDSEKDWANAEKSK